MAYTKLVVHTIYSNAATQADPTGYLTTDQTHAVVLDMATIPEDQTVMDQLWLLVRRVGW